MWGKGIEEGGRGGNKLKIFGRWKILTWSVEEKNGERNVYFVCDSNGRWLKDSTFVCCMDVILSVEGIIVLVIKVRCLL
jgi:hypothetical protein